jgi:filamentous hemagglutinin family protein
MCVLFARMTCFANPTGGVVINGDAIIQNGMPGLTTITQSTDRAVIDWQSFSIGAGERTNFIVPNATSATLNRVLGGDPSILNGSLTSNGHLFLINSNGIVFGSGAMVDVAGLTASTLNIGNEMFMSGGDMVFAGHSQAGIKNAGTIKASSGDVFLIGYQVSNSGTIRAPNGTVGLAAGSEVLIRAAGDERVVVRTATGAQKKYGVSNSGVIEANVAELKAHGGNVYAMAIRNTGRVAATGVTTQGGRILLTADGGKIQNSGSLVARRQSGNGGLITVNAGNKGSVDINGRVDADGPDGAGGKIIISGEKIEVRRAIAVTADGKNAGGQIEIGSTASPGTEEAEASQTLVAGLISASSSQGFGGEIRLGGNLLTLQCGAEINANGSRGGGQIFAGGGWPEVGSSVLDSTCVTVEDGALLTASALCNGDGGKIVVSAKYGLDFQGLLQALGGSDAGNGGAAELRAGGELGITHISGRVDLSAADGRAGTLLLYSNEWEISNRCLGASETNSLSAEDIGNFLNSANLTIQSALGNAGGGGNIVLSGTVTWCSANSLTINAACDFLLIDQAGDAGVIDAQGAGGVTINAGRFVSLETGTRIGTTGGDVLINANREVNSSGAQAGITLGGDITTAGGNVSLSGVGVRSTGGSVDADDGMILVDGNDGFINLAGALRTTNTSATAVRVIDASSVTLGDVTSAGTVVLGGANGDNVSGTVAQTGIISADTLTGNTGGAVFLDGKNLVANLGPFVTTGAFTFNDAAGGLNVAGGVETRGGAATISTAGGALALGGNNISTNGGNVSLTGTGVTSNGGTVNAGGGTILVDGNDGVVDLAGTLTTTNETATAVRIIDATTTRLGNITTGAAGVVLLGGNGGDNLSGAVTQAGAINAGTVTGNGGSTVTLDGSNTVVNLGEWKSADAFVFKDTGGGLNVTGNVETNGGTVSVSTTGGPLALGNSSITTNGGDASLAGTGVMSTGGAVNAGGGKILVDGNDGEVNLAGALTTTNDTNAAVRVIDATTAKLGNITTGAGGTVVLGGAGADNLSGAVTQTGAIKTGTLTGNTGSTVMLDGSNTVVNLGKWKSADAFVFKDTSGGLNVTGNVETRGASISTTGGALALGGNNVTTNGGNVSLAGTGVTSTGGTVDAGGGTILVDGNDGAVSLAGALKTTNQTAAAVRVIDAKSASLGDITTGAAGAVVLGEAGADGLSGAVAQTGVIKAAGVILAGDGDFTLTAPANAIGNVATQGSVGSLSLENGAALTIGRVGTAGGVSATGDIRISSSSGMVVRENITSQGGVIALSAPGIEVNSATISSTGTAAVTLTAGQFLLANQPVVNGVLVGTGTAAQISLNDSSLTKGESYTISADKIIAGVRSYAFQNVSVIRLDLGAGDDRSDTNFFSFDQFLNAGQGANKLFVGGFQPANSPLTKPGFGTITYSGFAAGTTILIDGTPFGSLLLQSVQPPAVGGSNGSQTNNFNVTSIGGAAGLAGALGAAGGSGGLLANVTNTMGQSLGFNTAGGGAPPSLNAQSQLNAATSASVESELNAALGGDGRMGVRSSTGLVFVDPQGPPPSVATVARLDSGMGLEALSELSFGVFGVSQVTLNNQFGAQALNLGGAPPSSSVQQKMALIASPQSFSTLSASLGGDGVARVENLSGFIALDLQDREVPADLQARLNGIISIGALGELMLALGGTGEAIVTDSLGLVSMHASGTAPGAQVSSAILAMLAAPRMSQMSLVLGGTGAGVMKPEDGILSTALNAELPGPFVKARLADATSPQSVEELDNFTR